MPVIVPAFTPNTQLIPIPFKGIAFNGLTTENEGAILPPVWATELDNAVFDSAGRPAARKGWASSTTSPGSTTNIQRIFEYYKADGTSEVIFSTDGDIYDDVTSSPASIDGSLTITDGNIKFVNFNDKVVAFGIGSSGIPAVRTTGDFANITVNSGTAPTGGIGTSAFGRLWAVDTDGKTLRYSALLDETRWDSTDGGGSIDFSKVWPSGQDDIVAVEELDGDLVVFGSNNTVIMTDGAEATLGVEPTDLYVSSTIPGLGAISQFAIARAVGDLWVLTPTGVVGLKRELIQRSTPITNISQHVQSQVIEWIGQETNLDDITLMYSPKEAFVLLIFPTTNKVVCFDTRQPIDQSGIYRISTWSLGLQTAAYIRSGRKIYGALSASDEEIFTYTGSDDDGSSFIFSYLSPWLDLGPELNAYLKFVKRMTSFSVIEQDVNVTHTVEYDFGAKQFTVSKAAAGGRTIEWGQFEWGANGLYDKDDSNATAGTDVAEWAGGASLRTIDVPGQSGGQYIQVGVSLDTSAGDFSLQQINLYAKAGRLAS